MAELTRIHSTESAGAINVVFVHGLGGHPRQTWMYKSDDEATLWPKWIGEDADCNVWILGYDAALSGWTEGAMHLVDQGIAFMSDLLYEPGLHGRPLVLVGHSLGGLVIKSGMVQAETLDDPRFFPLLETITGVVFVGTPHQGSSLATVAAALSGVLRTNPQVVNMKSDDAWLKALNGQFRAVHTKRAFQVSVFSETQGVLLGRKLFGFAFGTRVLIVDRNSSDPQIPGVAPTPIDGDHVQIAKPVNRKARIHKALLAFISGLGTPLTRAPNELSPPLPVPDTEALRHKLHRASAPLLTWPTSLPDGTWLERAELQHVVDAIDTAPSSLTLLLGEPGSGKSALLARLAQSKYADGWPVLAIKADRVPPDVVNNDALARYLAIGSDPIAAVRELAARGPVLVVIDQLDALADLVVQHSTRLRVILDLIHDLADTPNVHIASSCRTFEQRHDPSLRNLDATAITLNLPEWEAVKAVLHSRGVNADGWNNEIKMVLRSPHALDVFLTLLQSTTELGLLSSFQGMLQLQWETQVLSDGSARRKQAMLALARTMAEREVLGLPLAAVEDWYPEIQQLTAAGLLRFDQGVGRVEFRHQTLYEFVRARSFLDEAGSLTEAVLRGQGSLRMRPQLWHALAFFRTTSPEGYGTELAGLWSAPIRPHLKMLIAEFLGRQVSPLPAEIQLVYSSLDDKWFKPRFVAAAVGSPGWLATLAEGQLPAWMALPNSEAGGLIPLLDSALSIDVPLVTGLVRQVWLPDASKDELSWRVLGMGSVAPQSQQWVGDLETIASRTPLAAWTVGHVAGVVSAALPEQAPRLVAAWLRQQLQQVRAKQVGADQDAAPSDAIRTILEARQFHDLPAIAEASPQAFVTAVWPVYLELLESSASGEHAFLVGFRHSSGLISDEMDDEDGRIDRPLLEAMWKAVQGWARNDPVSFLDFVNAHPTSDLLVAERLVAKGLEQCAAAFTGLVLGYLEADPRRLVLGPYTDVHKESVALIQALSPHLDQQQFAQLEALVTGWSRYKAQPEGEDAATRLRRLRWSREHRLRLLRALPKDKCSAAVQRQIEEEERAFPGLDNADVRFSGVHAIGSPVTAEQMAKAKDEDVLNLFGELNDDSGWDHPKHRMKGGAIQAGRELAELAKKDLAKVLRIVRALKPTTNEVPVATVLRELVPAGYPTGELFALVEELDKKGFKSEWLRHEAAYAVAAAATAASPVPDSLMALMESWLTPVEPHVEDNPKAAETPREEAILWGHGSLNALPNGNFPILTALTSACFNKEPMQVDRWLGILERHAANPESVTVWQAMTWRHLADVQLADRARAETFLDQIFGAYSTLLESSDGVRLLAKLFRWARPTKMHQWVKRMEQLGGNEQGVGELALLRHAMFPAEGWAHDMVIAAMAAEGEHAIPRRIGVAYGVAHLWATPMARPVVQPHLLQLLTVTEVSVLKALDHIFLGDGFKVDPETRQLLEALADHTHLLTQPHAERFPEILEGMVTAEPIRVCRVANALLDVAGEQMGNIATSWYLGTEWLLAIALRLQDLGEPHRTAGSALFERMLEFNMPQARELTLDLDKRTAVAGSSRPPSRRRSTRKTPRRRT